MAERELTADEIYEVKKKEWAKGAQYTGWAEAQAVAHAAQAKLVRWLLQHSHKLIITFDDEKTISFEVNYERWQELCRELGIENG